MKTQSRLRLVLLALAATFALRLLAQDAAPPPQQPFAATAKAISVTLTKISAQPAKAPADTSDIKALTRNCHAALTALVKRIGDAPVPADYAADFTRAEHVLEAVAAEPAVSADDVMRIKSISDDIHAKRRWADKHRDAPAGPITLEVATAKGKAPVSGFDIWSRSAIDEQSEPMQPATVGTDPRQVSLPPGSYFLWLRSRGATPADGPRRAFAVDGAPTRVELAAP
jgi:hypothetical protein